jgi:putrescine transport system substrate-binding protein
MISRRTLAAVGIAALACLAGITAGAEDRAKVLNLYSWTDYFPKSLRAQFQAQTGVRVNLAVFDSPDTVETVLSVGRSGYDLVIVNAAPHLGREAPKGFFKKLDKARIPNLKNTDPQVMQVLQQMDPGNQYAVPWMWGTTGIMYDRDKIKSLQAVLPANPLDLLFKKELSSKFAGCGISMLDNWQDVMPMVARYLGQPDISTDAAALDAVVSKLLEAKPYLRRIASSGYFEQLANGELCLALGYSGDAMIARRMVKETQGKRVVEYAFPRERTPLYIDAIAIPADAPNPDAAQAFVNFIMRPDVSAAVVRDIGFAPGNAAAVPLLEPAVRNNPAVFPPADLRARFALGRIYNATESRIYNRAWQRFKTGI